MLKKLLEEKSSAAYVVDARNTNTTAKSINAEHNSFSMQSLEEGMQFIVGSVTDYVEKKSPIVELSHLYREKEAIRAVETDDESIHSDDEEIVGFNQRAFNDDEEMSFDLVFESRLPYTPTQLEEFAKYKNRPLSSSTLSPRTDSCASHSQSPGFFNTPQSNRASLIRSVSMENVVHKGTLQGKPTSSSEPK